MSRHDNPTTAADEDLVARLRGLNVTTAPVHGDVAAALRTGRRRRRARTAAGVIGVGTLALAAVTGSAVGVQMLAPTAPDRAPLADGSSSPAPAGSPVEVLTLAKVDGWQEARVPTGSPYAVFEVAYDVDTARAMWDVSVPDDLPARNGDPSQTGLYGDLSDVDFTEQAVGLWSSGQSGTCPGWLESVQTSADGTSIAFHRGEAVPDGYCTDDYSPYRTLVALDRSALPTPDALASVTATLDGPGHQDVAVGTFPLAATPPSSTAADLPRLVATSPVTEAMTALMEDATISVVDGCLGVTLSDGSQQVVSWHRGSQLLDDPAGVWLPSGRELHIGDVISSGGGNVPAGDDERRACPGVETVWMFGGLVDPD